MITKEEFIREAKKSASHTKRFFIISNIIIVMAIADFIISIIFPKGSEHYNISRTSSVIKLLAFIFYLILFISELKNSGRHGLQNRRIQSAAMIRQNSPYSLSHRNSLSDGLSAEKDPRVRAELSASLFSYYLITGDAQAAYNTLLNDTELFARDPYFEVQYLNNLVNYYCLFANDDVSLKYAEDAARRSDEIMKNYPRKDKMIFALISKEFDNGIMLAYRKGDWQECFDMISLRIEYYSSRFKKIKSMTVQTALDRIMQAECLYHLGKYEEALRLVSENYSAVSYIPYQARRADTLRNNIISAVKEKINGSSTGT